MNLIPHDNCDPWLAGWKYVLLDEVEGKPLITPILFPPYVQHEDIVRAFAPRPVVGAGFIRITDDGRVQTYGRSESLGIESLKGDADFFEPFNFPNDRH